VRQPVLLERITLIIPGPPIVMGTAIIIVTATPPSMLTTRGIPLPKTRSINKESPRPRRIAATGNRRRSWHRRLDSASGSQLSFLAIGVPLISRW